MPKKKSTRFRLIDAVIIVFCIAGSVSSGMAFWNEYDRTLSKLNEEPIGTITYKKRTVQRKFLEHVIWDRLKQESPVYNGDTIRTIELSEVVITFKDITTRLMLNENTLIQIYYTDEFGAKVDFSGGNMAVDSGTKSVMITSGSSQIIIEGKANLDKGNEGFSLSVTDGTVTYDGENLNTGDIYTLDSSGTRTTTPAIAITSFGSLARVLASPGERVPVTFSWNAIHFNPGTTVIVEVALDRNFGRIVERSQTAGTSLSLLLEGGAYWWRTFPTDDGSEPVNGIHPGGTLEVMISSPPALLTPAQQAELFSNENHDSAFSWTSSSGASAYLFEISSNPDMSGAFFARNVQGTSIVVPGLDTGSYFWRVSPLFPDWIIGSLPPSQTGSFAITNSRPILAAPPSETPEQAAEVPEQAATTPEPASVALEQAAATLPPDATPEPVAVEPPPPEQPSAPDDTVVWQENGHRYLVVNQSMVQNEAEIYAKSKGGYLATITSRAEQEFIVDLFLKHGNRNNYWLGGYREGKDWKWVTGEPFDYTNWLPSQPDNYLGKEDKLSIVRIVHAEARQAGGKQGQWNDNSNNNFSWGNYGCIIEWDAP